MYAVVVGQGEESVDRLGHRAIGWWRGRARQTHKLALGSSQGTAPRWPVFVKVEEGVVAKEDGYAHQQQHALAAADRVCGGDVMVQGRNKMVVDM